MVDPAMIAVRWALYALLSLGFGLPLFALTALRGPERQMGTHLRFRTALAIVAVAGIILSALWLAMLAATLADTPLRGVSADTIGPLIDDGPIGTAWKVRVAALLLALPLILLGGRFPRIALPLLTVLGAVALGSLAWTGHGAIDEGAQGRAHLLADIVHLLAAGAWAGALAAFLALTFDARTNPALAHRVLHGFAGMGTAIVLLLLGTGLVNGWMLVGADNVAALATSDYGRLLLVKLALFGGMVALAAANRFRHTPALGIGIAASATALVALRRSLIVETLAGFAILLLVAWMGMLPPPASG